MCKIFSLFIVIICHNLCAQDTLRVLFVYGSKPNSKGEVKKFGGIHGGHISLQYSFDIPPVFMLCVLNFGPPPRTVPPH